jgi:hypothetical protein
MKELIGFHPERLGQDILFGLLWLVVLYVPFVIAVMGTMFIMYGTDLFHHFQTVIAGDIENFTFSRPWVTAVISLIPPFFNAPIVETYVQRLCPTIIYQKV